MCTHTHTRTYTHSGPFDNASEDSFHHDVASDLFVPAALKRLLNISVRSTEKASSGRNPRQPLPVCVRPSPSHWRRQRFSLHQCLPTEDCGFCTLHASGTTVAWKTRRSALSPCVPLPHSCLSLSPANSQPFSVSLLQFSISPCDTMGHVPGRCVGLCRGAPRIRQRATTRGRPPWGGREQPPTKSNQLTFGEGVRTFQHSKGEIFWQRGTDVSPDISWFLFFWEGEGSVAPTQPFHLDPRLSTTVQEPTPSGSVSDSQTKPL